MKGDSTQTIRGFQADFHGSFTGPCLTAARRAAIHWRVRFRMHTMIVAAFCSACGMAAAAPDPPPPVSEAEVLSEPIPPEVSASAVAAVAKLGDEVVLGRYQAAIERMNPLWKHRTAGRIGGMEALEKQLAGVAAEMLRQGVSMISFRPEGRPRVYGVSPDMRTVSENGRDVRRLVHTQWLVLVPTVSRFRIMREGDPRPLVIESTGFQAAISDRDRLDWTFIDGAGLSPAELRGLFITLPPDIELPPVGKREVR